MRFFLIILLGLIAHWSYANHTSNSKNSSTSSCTQALSLSQLPGWNTDHQSDLANGLLANCEVLKKSGFKNSSMQKFCAELPQAISGCSAPNKNSNQNSQIHCNIFPSQNLQDQNIRALLDKYFQAVPITNSTNSNNSAGLFTGYYEPSMKGSLTKTSIFDIPIYGKPSGLVETKNTYKILNHGHYESLPNRAEISQDILNNHYLPNTPILAWVSSEIDSFFLQIQGSGEILLPNHQELLVGYAGQNGKKYVPIGAYLIKIGALTPQNISMQSIKAWLETHPNQAQKIMDMNPSFVFFRVLENIDQPIGAHGTQLTPYRSLAIDPKYLNLGTPVWLSTYLPMNLNSSVQKGVDFNHLLLAEDTGGAIKGPVRGDIYFGSGPDAEWLAGHMQSPGKLWALEPHCSH